MLVKHGFNQPIIELISREREWGALRGQWPLTYARGVNGGTGALTYQYRK